MTRSSACGRLGDQGGKRPSRQARQRRKKRRKKKRRKKRWSLRRKEGSAEGDPDGGQGQWPAHRGTGDCPVACGVDLVLVRAARHCLVPGGQTAQTPTSTPPLHCAHTPAGVWCWHHGQCWGSDVRHGVVPVLWQRDQEGEDTGADQNRRGHGSHKSKRSGDASAMQGRHTGDARRTPWASPWQPHGSGADLRWKGRREEENNVPVQSDQLLRRTGLAHQDKVQTGRQTGQLTLTVTHNRVDRATRWRRKRGEGGGRPAANDRGWRRWWTEGPEGRVQGERRRAGGWEPGAP